MEGYVCDKVLLMKMTEQKCHSIQRHRYVSTPDHQMDRVKLTCGHHCFCTSFQKLFGLGFSMFGSVVLKNENLLHFKAEKYVEAVVLYGNQ